MYIHTLLILQHYLLTDSKIIPERGAEKTKMEGKMAHSCNTRLAIMKPNSSSEFVQLVQICLELYKNANSSVQIIKRSVGLRGALFVFF
jgi:hypothetical protein